MPQRTMYRSLVEEQDRLNKEMNEIEREVIKLRGCWGYNEQGKKIIIKYYEVRREVGVISVYHDTLKVRCCPHEEVPLFMASKSKAALNVVKERLAGSKVFTYTHRQDLVDRYLKTLGDMRRCMDRIVERGR